MDHSRRRPHTPSKSERLRDQRHVRQRELAGALIPRLQLKRGVWGFCLLLKLKEAPLLAFCLLSTLQPASAVFRFVLFEPFSSLRGFLGYMSAQKNQRVFGVGVCHIILS